MKYDLEDAKVKFSRRQYRLNLIGCWRDLLLRIGSLSSFSLNRLSGVCASSLVSSYASSTKAYSEPENYISFDWDWDVWASFDPSIDSEIGRRPMNSDFIPHLEHPATASTLKQLLPHKGSLGAHWKAERLTYCFGLYPRRAYFPIQPLGQLLHAAIARESSFSLISVNWVQIQVRRSET